MWIKLGMLPRRSSSVCTAALVVRKCAHGKTDRHRAIVQGVDGIGQVQPQFFVDVQRPRLGDEPLGQRRMDTPVAPFVGIGQRRAGPAGGSPSFDAWTRGRSRCRAGFPGRSAGRRPWTGIARRRKAPDPVIAAIPVDDPRESSPWQEVHELSEQGLAGVHEHLLGETPKSGHHAFSLQTPQKSWLSKPAPLS